MNCWCCGCEELFTLELCAECFIVHEAIARADAAEQEAEAGAA